MTIPGDALQGHVNIYGNIIIENINISYIDLSKKVIITSGHALPYNVSIKDCDILYTSGFDTIDESKEIGIINIVRNSCSYENIINNKELLINNLIREYDTIVYNYYNRNLMECRIISYIDTIYNQGIININEKWIINHTITKLDPPYYLISGNTITSKPDYILNQAKKNFSYYNFEKLDMENIYECTSSGYSGSPWIVDNGINYLHLGTHIGRTLGIQIDMNNNVIAISYIAYAKPINDY